MSTVYGDPGYGGVRGGPTGQVNFNWIGEAFNLFGSNVGIWLLATFIFALLPIIAYAFSFQALMASVMALQTAGKFTPGNPANSIMLLSALPVGYLLLLVF